MGLLLQSTKFAWVKISNHTIHQVILAYCYFNQVSWMDRFNDNGHWSLV